MEGKEQEGLMLPWWQTGRELRVEEWARGESEGGEDARVGKAASRSRSSQADPSGTSDLRVMCAAVSEVKERKSRNEGRI